MAVRWRLIPLVKDTAHTSFPLVRVEKSPAQYCSSSLVNERQRKWRDSSRSARPASDHALFWGHFARSAGIGSLKTTKRTSNYPWRHPRGVCPSITATLYNIPKQPMPEAWKNGWHSAIYVGWSGLNSPFPNAKGTCSCPGGWEDQAELPELGLERINLHCNRKPCRTSVLHRCVL